MRCSSRLRQCAKVHAYGLILSRLRSGVAGVEAAKGFEAEEEAIVASSGCSLAQTGHS